MYFLRCILKKTYVRSFTIDLEIAVKYIKANIVPSLNRAKNGKNRQKSAVLLQCVTEIVVTV